MQNDLSPACSRDRAVPLCTCCVCGRTVYTFPCLTHIEPACTLHSLRQGCRWRVGVSATRSVPGPRQLAKTNSTSWKRQPTATSRSPLLLLLLPARLHWRRGSWLALKARHVSLTALGPVSPSKPWEKSWTWRCHFAPAQHAGSYWPLPAVAEACNKRPSFTSSSSSTGGFATP